MRRGEIWWGDQLMIVLAREVLERHPGAPILADVKASQVLFDEIARMGGQPVMTATGHSPIKAKLAELGAPLAGEMSGHIFFADGWYGFDDAVYVAVRLLGILGRSTEGLAELRDRLPRVMNTPELRFPCAEARKFAVVREVRDRLAAAVGRDDRHRRCARAHRRRLVAAARLEHAGRARRPRRIRRPQRGWPGSRRRSPRSSRRAASPCRRTERARATPPRLTGGDRSALGVTTEHSSFFRCSWAQALWACCGVKSSSRAR